MQGRFEGLSEAQSGLIEPLLPPPRDRPGASRNPGSESPEHHSAGSAKRSEVVFRAGRGAAESEVRCP